MKRRSLRRAPTSARALSAVLVFGLLAVGCSSKAEPEAGSTSSASPSTTPPPPPPIAPLTGLVASSEAATRRPVLAVKIDNHTLARPQIGLDKADIVYEEPVEGGITRFVAVFQSRDAATVGPIRSARLADIDILAEHGRALLAFSGAAGYVLRELPKANLVLLPHGRFGSIYRRDFSRRAPHNLFSSTKALYRASDDKGTPAKALFRFGDLPPAPAESPSASAAPSASATTSAEWPNGRRVRIPFSSSAWTAVWRYDASEGLYERSHGTVPHRTTKGRRVTASNVLVLRVVARRGARPDKAGNTTPMLDLVGEGSAVLLRDGVRIKGRWSRASVDAPTVLTDEDGRPMVFATGNSWVELVPTTVKPRYR